MILVIEKPTRLVNTIHSIKKRKNDIIMWYTILYHSQGKPNPSFNKSRLLVSV